MVEKKIRGAEKHSHNDHNDDNDKSGNGYFLSA
jgi:hypothetical protein